MKRIAVLMGGTSSEREVSLESGRNVAEALASLGKYEVVPVTLNSDALSELPENIDAAYVALHGGWGESGGAQAALDALAIPYTGPGAAASRAAMDKIATKRILDAAGVPNAPWYALSRGDFAATDAASQRGDFAASEIPPERLPHCELPFPVVVKAPADGSSVGVYKCADDAAFKTAVAGAWKIDKANNPPLALVEAFVAGREMTVGVIDGEPLPAIEIVAKGGWYGYDEKYNSDETRYPFLADSGRADDAALEARLRKIALAAYNALGCRGVTRVDFRVAEDGSPFVLELNSSPGFTAHSLVPKAGMRTGLSFAEVCDRILQSAKCDSGAATNCGAANFSGSGTAQCGAANCGKEA